MLKWKIFYTDGTTYTDQDGSALDCPLKTVQVIIVEDSSRGRRVLFQDDWFVWDPKYQQWFDCDIFSVIHRLRRDGSVTARPGEYVPEEDYALILGRATKDNYLPPRRERARS